MVNTIFIYSFGIQSLQGFREKCMCEADFLQLLHFNLWSATPTKPEFAFSLNLIYLLHTLNLECQVAVKDFCNALQTIADDVILFLVKIVNAALRCLKVLWLILS